MNDVDNEAFISLFRECFQKCFGHPLTGAVSETETRHLGNAIFEATGLVIGAKSLKNYAQYILNQQTSKPENPSVATLDTMARYVLQAPFTDEIQRKEKEAHFPYWFRYKNSHTAPVPDPVQTRKPIPWGIMAMGLALIGAVVFLVARTSKENPRQAFTDNFHSLSADSMAARGWMVSTIDSTWWNCRNEQPGMLSLFTLTGDNWPDTSNKPVIKNLLLRKIEGDCFTTEIHFADFIPTSNWQQAGLLLMEDTGINSKALRLSIGYNDFFGGFERPKEIILQCVSMGGNDSTRPEELAHIPLFTIPNNQATLVNNNLKYSALRIEKKNGHFRFLYSASPVANFAFKEAFTKELSIQPAYIGLFALQGFVNNSVYMPVRVSFFDVINVDCMP